MRRAGEPRILRKDGEDLAVIAPLPQPKRRKGSHKPSDADLAAFRSAAGGWKDLIDIDQFIEDVRESRRISSRPPVEL